MPYRIYQGKEILAHGPLTLRKGEIAVDLDSLALTIGNGLPGGVEIQSSGGGGGGATSFAGLTGQISESQIAIGTITSTQLRADNIGTATYVLTSNGMGGFHWVNPNQAGVPSYANVAYTGDYNDLTHLPALKTVSTSGSFYDLLDYPTVVSAFRNDLGYLTSATMSAYVTTATLNTAIASELGTLVGSSGTTFQVIQDLAAALTNTNTLQNITDALALRLRVDVNNQNLNPTQKSNAVTNLGLSPVAVSGSYNDLTDLPLTFSVPIASQSVLGGIRVGLGLTINPADGVLSLGTSSNVLGFGSPTSLKGQVTQTQGQTLFDSNYLYVAQSAFQPTNFVTNQTASSATSIITTIASQWQAQIQNAFPTYASGDWHIYNSTKTQDYSVTAITATNGVAYFTIDSLINYNTSDTFFIQTSDTWKRVGEMDEHGTSGQSIGGVTPTVKTVNINLPQGQAYGTTATLCAIDCTGITYGELAMSFTDSNNTEYYKGTMEVFLYPDLTYIIHPNIAGNKTDKVVLGFSNSSSGVYQNPANIIIPIYNGDKNVGNNQTNSTVTISQIKYTWLVRTNI